MPCRPPSYCLHVRNVLTKIGVSFPHTHHTTMTILKSSIPSLGINVSKNQYHIRIDFLQATNSVELMPGLLKSLKISLIISKILLYMVGRVDGGVGGFPKFFQTRAQYLDILIAIRRGYQHYTGTQFRKTIQQGTFRTHHQFCMSSMICGPTKKGLALPVLCSLVGDSEKIIF
jgi:hypothetical protein